jgi:hypothetical protein
MSVHIHAGMETECFREGTASEDLESKAFLQVYKSVLNSKATEDSLVSLLSHFAGHALSVVEYQISHMYINCNNPFQ